MHPRYLVAIDPGLSGTGWALWDRNVLHTVGTLYPGRDDETWDEAGRILASRLSVALIDLLGTASAELHIEFPMLMESIAGIAANRGGGMLKLAYLVGCITMLPIWTDVHLVTPLQWKGQLPKTIVQDRITATLGAERCEQLNIRSHAWDAVGIGLYALGVGR